MNRLVLIGNGFDLAHGLKTKYEDFINWYWVQRKENHYNSHNRVTDDGLCKIISSSIIPDKFWGHSDNFNIKSGDKYEYTPFFSNIIKSVETKGWVDIENEYYRLLEYHALEVYSEQEIATLNKQLQYIQALLTKYLTTINQQDISVIEDIKKKIYAPIESSDISIEAKEKLNKYIEWCNKQETDIWEVKLNNYGINPIMSGDIHRVDKFKEDPTLYTEYPRAYMLPENIMLLNFNYTKTANEYIENRDIFSLNHIHGVLESPDSMIFGYGDEFEDKYKKLQNLNNNECLTNIKTIRYQESDNYRKALAFMDSKLFQVCIMGHSCGNSDRTLLNTIFEHKNCISIKPYYYKKDDGTDSYIELVQNISRNFTDMKLMRDRVVNKTYCKPLVEYR